MTKSESADIARVPIDRARIRLLKPLDSLINNPIKRGIGKNPVIAEGPPTAQMMKGKLVQMVITKKLNFDLLMTVLTANRLARAAR